MKQFPRIWAVLLLMAFAIGAPSLAWWVSGSREADRESLRLKADARRASSEQAAAIARRLGERLERLRAAENVRPYYHYQNLYHDPRGASEGLSVVPSPLANGPSDPLILAHFQTTSDGRVTIPTLNEEVRSLSAPDTAKQEAIRATLAAAAPRLLAQAMPRIDALRTTVLDEQQHDVNETRVVAAPPAAVPAPDRIATHAVVEQPKIAAVPDVVLKQVIASNSSPPSSQTASQNNALSEVRAAQKATTPVVTPYKGAVQSNAIQFNATQNTASQQNVSSKQNAASSDTAAGEPKAEANVPPQAAEPVQTQVLDASAYTQNLNANDVYRRLRKAPTESLGKAQVPIAPPRTKTILVHTGDLEWQTIELGGAPALAALRPVVTPAGASLQGFVLAASALRDAVPGGVLVVSRGVHSPGTTEAAQVADAGWWIVVDETPLMAAAATEGSQRKAEFRRTFGVALAGGLLAFVVVAAMVWQTERLARERARFAAAAAHELRTPIASLRLYGEMLADQLGDPARTGEYARRIEEQASRLGRVVANMLEYSQLERGAVAVEPRPGDAGAAVADCIAQMRGTIEAAGCTLTLHVDEALPQTRFDRDALFHIVQNLVDNAEKYSRASAERDIEVGVARDSGGVAITVADRGPGLPAAIARDGFAPFRRGRATEQPAGLGLGLSLAQALARAQAATLTASPRQPTGTVFTIQLARV